MGSSNSLREEYLSIEDRSGIPNKGSYARRLAYHLDSVDAPGSWYQKTLHGYDAVGDSKSGSWRSRLLRSIKGGAEEENGEEPESSGLLTEDGSKLVTENGDRILLEIEE